MDLTAISFHSSDTWSSLCSLPDYQGRRSRAAIQQDCRPTTLEEQRKAKLAGSITIQSLSSKVQASLPPPKEAVGKPPTLLYSSRSSRTPTLQLLEPDLLLCFLRCSKRLSEQEEPYIALGKIRLAHIQLNSNRAALSETVLAHAMFMALPDPYNAMKQTY